jgi:hypothetical protein
MGKGTVVPPGEALDAEGWERVTRVCCGEPDIMSQTMADCDDGVAFTCADGQLVRRGHG